MADRRVQRGPARSADLARVQNELFTKREQFEGRSRKRQEVEYELVQAKAPKRRWDPSQGAGARVLAAMDQRGVTTRIVGDVILLAPPFVTTEQQLFVRRSGRIWAWLNGSCATCGMNPDLTL